MDLLASSILLYISYKRQGRDCTCAVTDQFHDCGGPGGEQFDALRGHLKEVGCSLVIQSEATARDDLTEGRGHINSYMYSIYIYIYMYKYMYI